MKSGSIEGNERELTVEEAADALNVSVAYVAALLDRGEIPCRPLEAGRRVRASDVRAYDQRVQSERRKVLDELTTEAEKRGLGY